MNITVTSPIKDENTNELNPFLAGINFDSNSDEENEAEDSNK